MNIVFVTGQLSGGGAERVISLITTHMAEAKHNISIVSFVSDDRSYYFSEHVKIYQYNAQVGLRFARILHKITFLKKIVKKEQADVVVSFMTGANVLSLIALMCSKIPVVSCERNDPNSHPNGKGLRIMRKLTYWTSEGFVFQTNNAKEFFSTKIQKRSAVIANPVNPNLPNPLEHMQTRKIVSVGRLEAAKNYEMAIRAFSKFHNKYPNYTYEIYGKGSKQKELSDLINELKLQQFIILKGYSDNIYPEIADAEMYVLSSNHEGMSNALMEAMALGLPCISTNHPIGGAKVLIQDGTNGFLVPVGDVDALAKKMHIIASNPTVATVLSQNAVLIKNKFSIDTIVSEWMDYLKKIVQG